MKLCPKCGKQKSLFAFYKDKSKKDGLTCYCKECEKSFGRKYYQTHKTKCKKYHREYSRTHRIKINKCRRKHYQTLIGYLRNCFHNAEQRCNNSNNPAYKNYGNHGIKCLFESSDEFVNYVVNELKIDPRGSVVHRIDSDGHYEPGNIKFLAKSEHITLHNLI